MKKVGIMERVSWIISLVAALVWVAFEHGAMLYERKWKETWRADMFKAIETSHKANANTEAVLKQVAVRDKLIKQAEEVEDQCIKSGHALLRQRDEWRDLVRRCQADLAQYNRLYSEAVSK